jgi:hypothetical protein
MSFAVILAEWPVAGLNAMQRLFAASGCFFPFFFVTPQK